MSIFVSTKIFRPAAFRAFDAAVNRDTRDGLLPAGDGQIAAFVQELGNGNKIDPALFHPSGDVTAEIFCGFGCGWRVAKIGRHAHGEYQLAATFLSNLVEHLANALDERIHFGNTLRDRVVFKETRESVEVKFDPIAVVTPHGFFDQPKGVVADLVTGKVHCSTTVVLFGAETPIWMVRQKLRAKKVVAVIIIHAKSEQRLASAPLRFSQHDRVWIDSGSKEGLHVLKPLLLGSRPFLSLCWCRMRPAHGADLGWVIHHLRVNADQHRIDAAAVVSDFLDQTFHVGDVHRHGPLAARLPGHARVAVKVVEHTSFAGQLGTRF